MRLNEWRVPSGRSIVASAIIVCASTGDRGRRMRSVEYVMFPAQFFTIRDRIARPVVGGLFRPLGRHQFATQAVAEREPER